MEAWTRESAEAKDAMTAVGSLRWWFFKKKTPAERATDCFFSCVPLSVQNMEGGLIKWM